MAATLDDIEAALFDQLETLLATASPAGPLASVLRFAIERGGGERTDRRGGLAPLGVVPAAMLAFERETYRGDVETAHLRRSSTIGRSVWQVVVVASDLRGDAAAVKGSSSTGLYALLGAVTAALSGLPIDGTCRGHRVELVDVSPTVARAGKYMAVVRVASERKLDSVAIPDDSDDLEGIDASVNLLPDSGDSFDPNPFGQFTADTTDDS